MRLFMIREAYNMPFRKFNHEITFMLGVAIYLVVLIIAGSGLSPETLLFPGLIMVAAGVIIGLKLLTYKFPKLKFLDPGNTLDSMIREKADQTPQAEEVSGKPSSIYEPIAFILWLITFPLGIYLVGFVATLGAWLFGFLFLISRIKLFKSLLICVCTLVGIYLIFMGILKVHFPQGILF